MLLGTKAFPALRQRQFRLYWLSTILFDIAQWAQMGLQAWLILEMTGSPVFMGVYTACRFVPKFLLVPVAGVVADRVNRRSVLLASQGTVLALTLLTAFMFSAGGGSVWTLLALNALLGAAFSFDQPARRSLLPNLVKRPDLLSAVAMNNSAFSTAVIVGPIVAAGLLTGVGITGALYLNALIFALSLAMLILMEPVSQAIRPDKAASIGGHFLEGLKFLRRTPIVAGVLLVSLFPGFLDRLFVLFLPVLTSGTTEVARDGGDLLPLIRGIGAIAGALILAAWGSHRVRGHLVMPVALACAATSALFIFAPSLSLSLAVLSTAGLLRAVLSSMTTTLLHINIPDDFRGRVMAI